MKTEYIKVPLKHINGCTFVQQKNTKGFFVAETSYSFHISFPSAYNYAYHNYWTLRDDDYTSKQFFALADFLNDNLNNSHYYTTGITNKNFQILLNAVSELTPDRMERMGSFNPVFYKHHMSITKNNAFYECNNKRYEVTKVVFNHKEDTGILEWKKEVHLFCKDNSKFTIVIDYNEFRFFMDYIQLSLLVNLHKYAHRNFISIINQEPTKCINEAISMGLI